MNYNVIFNNKVWALILILISVAAITVRYTLFTEKFFVDSTLLMQMEQSNMLDDGSFGSAALFFKYINFLQIDSLLGWSIYVSCIFFFINFALVRKIRCISFFKFVFVLVCLFLWYLFADGITKEVLQTIFFLIIYWIILNKFYFKKNIIKVLLGAFVLLISALLFREYYVLVSFFTIIIYMMTIIVKKRKIKSIYLFFCICTGVLIFLGIFMSAVSILRPTEYELIVSLRNVKYAYLMDNTDTFIKNLVDGDTVFIFIINYAINYIRLLLPVELIFIGKLYYIPFVLYQISFTYYYFKAFNRLNRLDDREFLCLIFLTSFIIVSAIMEPDFGSWTRHQSVCWFLLLGLLFNKNECNKKI